MDDIVADVMISALLMNEQIDRDREGWTTRINLRKAAKDAIRVAAKSDCISTATMIGIAIETYVITRSTA